MKDASLSDVHRVISERFKSVEDGVVAMSPHPHSHCEVKVKYKGFEATMCVRTYNGAHGVWIKTREGMYVRASALPAREVASLIQGIELLFDRVMKQYDTEREEALNALEILDGILGEMDVAQGGVRIKSVSTKPGPKTSTDEHDDPVMLIADEIGEKDEAADA